MSIQTNPVYDAILSRRSIRCFDETKRIEKDKIVLLLKAAMAAPSACNIQPWEFVVVHDDERVDRIKKSIQQYADYNVDTIIVICGSNEHIPWKDYGILDCALAMENMMILAPSIGLGTVCIGGFDQKEIRKIIDLPEEIEAIGMLYLGYPNEHKQPRTQYLEEAVHWDCFDHTRPRKPRPGNILVFGPESSI